VGPLLVIVFLLVPVVEIYVIIQVGQLIGPLPTLALLIFESLLGAWLLKREGRVAWASLQKAVASGRLPAQELVDAGLVLVGGTLLLAPGFLTDVVGFFFILPPTRPLARRLLIWLLVRRAARAAVRQAAWGAQRPPPRGANRRPSGRAGPARPAGNRRPSGKAGPKRVIPGELVTDSDNGPQRRDRPDPPGPQDKGRDDKGPGRAAGG
jgi:UPF0716 protein FxsA